MGILFPEHNISTTYVVLSMLINLLSLLLCITLWWYFGSHVEGFCCCCLPLISRARYGKQTDTTSSATTPTMGSATSQSGSGDIIALETSKSASPSVSASATTQALQRITTKKLKLPPIVIGTIINIIGST